MRGAAGGAAAASGGGSAGDSVAISLLAPGALRRGRTRCSTLPRRSAGVQPVQSCYGGVGCTRGRTLRRTRARARGLGGARPIGQRTPSAALGRCAVYSAHRALYAAGVYSVQPDAADDHHGLREPPPRRPSPAPRTGAGRQVSVGAPPNYSLWCESALFRERSLSLLFLRIRIREAPCPPPRAAAFPSPSPPQKTGSNRGQGENGPGCGGGLGWVRGRERAGGASKKEKCALLEQEGCHRSGSARP